MMKFSSAIRNIYNMYNTIKSQSIVPPILKHNHSLHPDVESEITKTASDFLKKGQVIAIPTDTIYGIAANAQDTNAVESIYKIKHREKRKPIALCVAKIDDIPRWAKVTIPNSLLESLLPGPVTLVFERTPELNPYLNAGVSLVGVRIPNHNLLIKIVEQVGAPLALTSANVSNAKSSLEINEFESLWPDLSLIIDEGKLGTNEDSRRGSTVIDLSVPGCFRVIRQGSALEVTKKKLNQFSICETFNEIS